MTVLARLHFRNEHEPVAVDRQTYDCDMRDALTLESELAQSIAEKVEVTVTGEEHQSR
jgi:hypothetical protein